MSILMYIGSTSDQTQESGSSYWLTQPILDTEQGLDKKNWWSQPPHSADFVDSRLYRTSSSPQQDALYNPSESSHGAKPFPLHRTSSYPQKEPQYSNTEPIPVPKSFISYPPSGAASHSSPGQPHHMNMPSPTAFQMPISAQNDLPLPQFPHGGMPPGSRFGRDLAHMGSMGLPTQIFPEKHALNSGQMRGNGPRFMPGLMQRPNGLMLPPRQQHGMLPVQQSPPHFSQLHTQMLGPQHSPPQSMQMFAPQHPPSQVMSRFDANFTTPDLSDPRARSMLHNGRQGQRHPCQDYEHMRMDNGWQRFRSKYMSTGEIENIARMQQAATQINDPYIDDYYHQACLAKKSAAAQLKRHFCPTLIRDPSSHAHSKDEPHAYLQVDALGRLPFSSIRRPRPLLDVEPASAPSDSIEKSASKPLEQEPMLAARITIEDGLCLLLDVDDIDRLLQFSQQQDGGLQLRNRREALLEKLAESLQLVDPLAPNKNAPLSSNDDVVFLRIVALPKGRKLLSRYLQLVTSGSELARIACMAVFRHLRTIFGIMPSNISAVETITKLASAISSCVCQMELSDLSACLAAIVCSSMQPPLRPLGSAAGDWASVIIKSVLDRATELLTNQHLASIYSMQNRALWQASFDAFFGMLTRYCMSKFDSVVHTAQLHPAAAAAISREMPVELLRASLPHTNEDQRKQLLSFAQRTVPVSSNSSHGSGTGPITSDSVPTWDRRNK
jgi:DNA topoisomerase 2-associated protein PAT1